MTRAALLLLAVCAAAGACGNRSPKTDYLIVTVDARPAVHDAASISVTLVNAGTMRTDALMLNGKAFPVTFSISAPGRTGDLAITVDAKDDSGLVIGHGSAMTTVTAPTARVMLDSTDFVVNTDYAGDQFPADDFGTQSVGFQLAALPDGTWTAVFRDGCMQGACNVFVRRFSANGKPAPTQAAAGTNAFVVTARPSDLFTEPAVASSQAATVALWNFDDPSGATGVACRSITAAGALGPDQTAISSDTNGTGVTVAALSTGDFAACWNGTPAGGSVNLIRAAILKPDCTVSGMVQTVSTGSAFVERNAVAASADHVLFTWLPGGSGGDLHALVTTGAVLASGTALPADTVLVPQTATDKVVHARIAAAPGGGFALAVRWISRTSSTAPGKIELYQVSAAGTLVGTPVLVTDQSGSDFGDDEGFGFASQPDGTVMLAWHVCSLSGDPCTVSGRVLTLATAPGTGPAAIPATDPFAIPTTTGNSQKRPSVVGLPDAFAVVWSDSSGKPPDTAGQAVRARIIYPPSS